MLNARINLYNWKKRYNFVKNGNIKKILSLFDFDFGLDIKHGIGVLFGWRYW